MDKKLQFLFVFFILATGAGTLLGMGAMQIIGMGELPQDIGSGTWLIVLGILQFSASILIGLRF